MAHSSLLLLCGIKTSLFFVKCIYLQNNKSRIWMIIYNRLNQPGNLVCIENSQFGLNDLGQILGGRCQIQTYNFPLRKRSFPIFVSLDVIQQKYWKVFFHILPIEKSQLCNALQNLHIWLNFKQWIFWLLISSDREDFYDFFLLLFVLLLSLCLAAASYIIQWGLYVKYWNCDSCWSDWISMF